jgi:hypothetical protein
MMAARLTLIFAYLSCHGARGQTWPIPYEVSPDTLPNIEVHLAPPVHPLPQVAAEIQVLDKMRERSEEEKMSQLEFAFNAALESAKQQIGEAVGLALRVFDDPRVWKNVAKTGSFLRVQMRSNSAEEPSVRVKALAAAPPDPAIKIKIDQLEEQRSAAEALMLDVAIAEMGELTKIAVAELEKQLQLQIEPWLVGGGSLLHSKVHQIPGSPEGLPKQLNVRVGASDVPYPTIASLVQDMEARRDTAESLLRQRVLELELKLLKAENVMIKDALDGAVGRVLAQYGATSR